MKISDLYSQSGKLFQGLKLIRPDVINDERGFFMESWNKEKFKDLGLVNIDFVQDNHSFSRKNVLRGFHYQLPPYQQVKLVRCVVGEIFDVVIDIRQSSFTFREWIGVNLSSDNYQQLLIPEGFAHGFLTLSEHAEVIYKVTNFWNKESERSISWKDPTVRIEFPSNNLFKLSAKDDNAPFLSQLKHDEIF